MLFFFKVLALSLVACHNGEQIYYKVKIRSDYTHRLFYIDLFINNKSICCMFSLIINTISCNINKILMGNLRFVF